MSTLFVIAFAVGIWHFTYEGILLPGLRLELRYRLYRYRDQLRALKYEHDDKISEEVFRSLHDSITNLLNILPAMNWSFVSRVNQAIEADGELKKKIQKRQDLLSSCEVEQVHKIKSKIVHISFAALLVNMGGWFIYALPFALIAIAIVFIINALNKCRRFFAGLIESVTFAPQHWINRMVPQADFVGRESFDC